MGDTTCLFRAGTGFRMVASTGAPWRASRRPCERRPRAYAMLARDQAATAGCLAANRLKYPVKLRSGGRPQGTDGRPTP